jgi:hypothetical protein
MIIIADQSCRENQNTNLILTFFNLFVYEIIGKICRARETTDCMHRKYVIGMPDNAGKNTDTHSKCIILYNIIIYLFIIIFLTAVQNIYSSTTVYIEPIVALP